MATGLPCGARAERAAQTRVLRAALDSIRPQRPVAAFDIDSTILVNKVRQARIVREYGQLRGDRRLAACQPEAVISWDLRDTLRLCGLHDSEITAIVPKLPGFFRDRFFSSEYCKDDTPAAGAREHLSAVPAAGRPALYATGRHAR